ncbi:hypothetical protein VTI74DRAFT_909 [Chaetomium olivicolor]
MVVRPWPEVSLCPRVVVESHQIASTVHLLPASSAWRGEARPLRSINPIHSFGASPHRLASPRLAFGHRLSKVGVNFPPSAHCYVEAARGCQMRLNLMFTALLKSGSLEGEWHLKGRWYICDRFPFVVPETCNIHTPHKPNLRIPVCGEMNLNATRPQPRQQQPHPSERNRVFQDFHLHHPRFTISRP